jgi:hypothetical protein
MTLRQHITQFISVKMIQTKKSNIFFFETGSHCVAQAGLELVILLPQPLKCWDYRCELSHLAKELC